MKNLNVLFTMFLLVTSSLFMTASAADTKPTGDLKTQVSNMLNKIQFETDDIDGNMEFSVNFIINDKKEIIVLSTNDAKYDIAVKNALNYKKINLESYKMNTTYQVSVNIQE